MACGRYGPAQPTGAAGPKSAISVGLGRQGTSLPPRLHGIRANRTRRSQPRTVFLMVIEIAILIIAVSPHSADTARPLIAPGGAYPPGSAAGSALRLMPPKLS